MTVCSLKLVRYQTLNFIKKLKMLTYIKNNFPVFILLVIVVAGLGSPFFTGRWILAPRLVEVDSECYGVDVPQTIEYSKVLHFCSCIHTIAIENKAEKYRYCTHSMEK